MTDSLASSTRSRGAISRFVPGVGLLRSYERVWLRVDVLAGFTLAAYSLPAIGDASLSGTAASTRLVCMFVSGLVFWLFCSSRHTTITVTSAISLLVGSSLAGLATGDPSRFGALAACTALLVAVIAFLARVVRAGAIVNFISETAG
jgi:sulfate permease, SulP family